MDCSARGGTESADGSTTDDLDARHASRNIRRLRRRSSIDHPKYPPQCTRNMRVWHIPSLRISHELMTVTSEPAPLPAELAGPQPVEAYIHRALAENRTVQAAFHNVQSLKYRFPQVTTLEDPVASNVVFPIPSVAPQYSLMGYNPYNLTLAQQFPWFGTLQLRGEVAERDVQVALAELAAAQLDSVAAVKRGYCNLFAAMKADEILAENRKILEDFRAIARAAPDDRRISARRPSRRAVDRRARPRAGHQPAGIAAARRRSLARFTSHPTPSSKHCLSCLGVRTQGARPPQLRGPGDSPRATGPARRRRARREGRRAGQEAVLPEHHPRLDLHGHGENQRGNPQDRQRPAQRGSLRRIQPAGPSRQYQAGVLEAQERACADAKLYEAERDEAFSEIQDFMVQAKVQENVLSLLRDSIEPRTRRNTRSGAKRLRQGQRRLRDGPLGLERSPPGAAPGRPGLRRARQGLGRARARRRAADQRRAQASARGLLRATPAPAPPPPPSAQTSPFRAQRIPHTAPAAMT